MSAWRALVQEIHWHGPVVGSLSNSSAIQCARLLGVVESCGEHRWKLTPLGVELIEGRVVQVESRPGGRRFVATWLRSLPQGVKFT